MLSNGRFHMAALCILASLSSAACSASTASVGQPDLATQSCIPNSTQPCPCPQGLAAVQTCNPDGRGYGACSTCEGAASGGIIEATGGIANPTGGVVPQTGGAITGTGGVAVGTGGVEATGGAMGTGGAVGTGGDSNASGSVSGIPDADLEMLRQACVDEINMYRATLNPPATPLTRASTDRELCSDQGAQKDASTGTAHSSAGTGNPCNTSGTYSAFPNFTAQDTCPGYMVGGFGGSATIVDALKQCLAQMWAEGEPPGGKDKCIADYLNGTDTSCFLAYGHYINMSGDSTGVSCGFYDMGNSTYWMNQDFL